MSTAVLTAPLDPHAMPCGLLSVDDEGRVMRANAALTQMLQLPLQQIEGRAFEQLLNPASKVYHQLVLNPMLRMGNRASEVLLTLRTAGGRDLPVLVNATRRMVDELGVNDYALMPMQQRLELESKLLQVHRAAEHMPGVLFRLVREPDGRFRAPYASKGVVELTGLEPQQLLEDASPFFERIHPDDLGVVMEQIECSRTTLRSQFTTYRLRNREGEWRYVQAHSHIHTEPGDLTVWEGALYDVTRQQQLDQQLRDFDKLQAVATLAAGVAHDFNNLLGSITGLAELCQLEAAEGSRQSRNLQRILKASHKAAGLVRQLLDFSRQTPQQRETLTLGELLGRTKDILAATLPSGIQLIVEVEADGWVHVDPLQLEQSLLNLVNNAVHAMQGRAGGIWIVADIAHVPEGDQPGAREADMARLRVIDAGQGIPRELQKKIFDPFFTTKPVGEGTGLGLAAVQGIISGHGGYITLDSTPGEGSTFSLLLPRAEPPSTVDLSSHSNENTP